MEFPEVLLFGSLKYKGKQAGDIDLCLLQKENWEEQLEALEGLGQRAGKNIDLFIDPGSEISAAAYFDMHKRSWSFEDRYTTKLDFSGYLASEEEIVGLAKGVKMSLPKANLAKVAEGRGPTRFGDWGGQSEKEEVVEMVKNGAGWWRCAPKAKLREGPFASLEEAAATSSERVENLAWRMWWKPGTKQEEWLTYPVLSKKIREMVAQFEAVGRELDRNEEWSGTGRLMERVWTCDAGAVFAACLADELGIERELQVGLYWHKSWKSLGKSLGQSVEECQEERGKWDEVHQRTPLDEHHHWVKLTDGESGQVWIFDPNGEARGEARVHGESVTYETDDREAKWSGISSTTDVRSYMLCNHKRVMEIWQTLRPDLEINL
jgi:hypothetical protein